MKSDLFNEAYGLFYLSQIKGLGNHTICQLLKQYQRPSAILDPVTDLPGNLNKLLAAAKNNTNWQKITQQKFTRYQDCLSILDAGYPPLLKNIYDPPLFLFYRGDIKLLSSAWLLTIVGSRRLTDCHQKTLKQLIGNLKGSPLILASGLAFGIDGLVHQQALANDLPTISVLGSGLNDEVLYPAANKKLANDILAAGGLLVSEYPPDTKPEIFNFPRRNRILAGLSKMTIVISGAAKSGTLITAQIALDEGREVYALPCNINITLSQGPNQLIKQGANLLLSADDVLQVYNLKNKIKKAPIEFDTALQRTIYSLIQLQPLTANRLSVQLKLELAIVNQTISELELKGLVNINQTNQLEIT